MKTRILLLVGIPMGLLLTDGCKKEALPTAASPNYTANSVNPSSNQREKEVSVGCGCPKQLILAAPEDRDGDDKGSVTVATARKLHAFFNEDSFPDQAGIKSKAGITDVQDVRRDGRQYRWKSKDKYTTVSLEMVLYKNGKAVKVCSYGKSGSLIVPPAPPVYTGPAPVSQIQNFQALPIVGGAEVSWTATTEVAVEYYVLDRMVAGGVFTPLVAISAIGSGSYYFYDDMVVSGTYSYRIRGELANGTEVVFPASSVVVP